MADSIVVDIIDDMGKTRRGGVMEKGGQNGGAVGGEAGGKEGGGERVIKTIDVFGKMINVRTGVVHTTKATDMTEAAQGRCL